MAHTSGTTARTQRLIALVATCLLGVTTAYALGRVFDGRAPTWRLMMVALASAAIACLMERRNLLVATLVSAVALIVAVGILVFPWTTWHGLPTLDTLRAIGHAAGLVGQQARLEVAPTAPLTPLMLAALTATWAAIFSAHALAFRAGSPLLALLPPIALIAFADTVLEEFVKPIYGVMFLAAALVVIFADGLRRVQGWGPVWTGPGRAARITATTGRGARRVAATAVGLALVAPILLPGFGSKAVVDFSTDHDDRVHIDLLVNVANALNQREPVDVFTVQTSRPAYYRLAVLTRFDGSGWEPETERPELTDLQPDAPLSDPYIAPSVIDTAPRIDQRFRIATDSAVPFLPAATQPLTVDTSLDGVGWDASSGAFTLASPEDGVDEGTEYGVTSLAISPTPEQLRHVVFPRPPDGWSYTQVPSAPGLDPRIITVANDWTEGIDNTYDKIIAIQDHLANGGFQYDKSVPRRDDSTALADFLLIPSKQRGFCQQFAGAMAALLRVLGIPSRVAVGFTPGTEIDPTNHTYLVTTEEAHAWVEVLFPTYGWLAFEPTPHRENPVALAYTSPADSVQPCVGKGCRRGPRGGPPTKAITPLYQGGGRFGGVEGREPTLLGRPSAPVGSDLARNERWFTARKLLVIGLGLLILFLLSIPPARELRRRRRLRHAAGEPRRLILTTYDVFTERAGELGFRKERGETLQEYQRRMRASGALSNGDLERLTRVTGGAAYGPDQPEEDDVRVATEAADTTLRDLRSRTPFTQRVMGRYRRED